MLLIKFILSICVFFLPGIFLYNRRKDLIHNILFIFSFNFLFDYIVATLLLTFNMSNIISYLIILFISTLSIHLVNKELYQTYYQLYIKVRGFFVRKVNEDKAFRIYPTKLNKRWLKELVKSHRYLYIFVFWFVIITFYHSILFPATSADAIFTHMPLIKFLFEKGGFIIKDGLNYLNHHFLFDVSPFHIIGYLFYLLVQNDILVRFINPTLFTLSILAFQSFLKNLNVNEQVIPFSLLAYSSSPAILAVSSTLNNDISSVAFFVLALYFMSESFKNRFSYSSFVFSYFLAGLMLCSKQTSIPNYIFFQISTIFFGYRSKISKKLSIFPAFIFSLVIGSVRYIISYINFADPFYPYLKSWFKFISYNTLVLLVLLLFLIISSCLALISCYPTIITRFINKHKRIKIINYLFSITNVIFIILYIKTVLGSVEYRLNAISIIALVKISNENQPLGALIVSFSIIWIISAIFSSNIIKKFFSLYVSSILVILLRTFLTTSISRYYLIIIPFLSYFTGEAIIDLFVSLNKLIENVKLNKFRLISLKLTRILIAALILSNVLFSISLTFFGFKTITDPIYYPFTHPFNPDHEDLLHWKTFEIKLVDYINSEIPTNEYIILFPYNAYYIINYSRLIFPASEWFLLILHKYKNINLILNVLKFEYNISYIAILNSIIYHSTFFSNPNLKNFFMNILNNPRVIPIKTFDDTRRISTYSDLHSILYYIT